MVRMDGVHGDLNMHLEISEEQEDRNGLLRAFKFIRIRNYAKDNCRDAPPNGFTLLQQQLGGWDQLQRGHRWGIRRKLDNPKR